MEAKLFCQTRNLLPIIPPRHTQKLNFSPIVAVLMRPSDKINISGVEEKSTSSLAENFAGLTTKTVYVDSWFDQLAMNHLSKSVQAATGLRNSKRGYESLVQAARDASRKFSLVQQRELVIEALHGAIPKFILDLVKTVLPQSKFTREYFAAFTTLFLFWLIGSCEVRESDFNGRKEKNVVHIKKCRFLEETNCVGMCTNLCKAPTQAFIKDFLGMPVNMVPNFEDMSCEMIFGEEPPALTADPAFNQPCYKLCKSKQNHRAKCSG